VASKDFYKILGVDKKASAAEIKKAYRKLAILHHPDKNKGDKKAEEKFKEANEANGVLSDPEKRKKYDQFGENWENPPQSDPRGHPQNRQSYQQQGGNQGQSFTFDNNDFENDPRFEDVFSQFFGGGRSRSNANGRDGTDIEAEVQTTLEDAFAGVTRILALDQEQHKLTLKKGVRDGQQFRLRGKGNPGQGNGKSGDLLVNIRILPHLRYTRTDNDLRCQQAIDLTTAVLGGKARVVTLHGEKMMTLQAGTQFGTTLRMRGLGMPLYDNPTVFGDLYVEVLVRIPSTLSVEERDLYEKLKKYNDTANNV
jgi:curved DNA-binding protein